MGETLYQFIAARFKQKFPDADVDRAIAEYDEIPAFRASGNHPVSPEVHYVMRLTTQWHLQEAFKAMKIDLDDPNVAEDLSTGNIGTAGRIAKVWCGATPGDDTELGGGRWSEAPRIATFPNETGISLPITKRVNLISNCSHHFVPFSTDFSDDSQVVISYIPKSVVLGISKLQRLVNWVGQRFWLQEDLTRELYNVVSEAARTEDVYIRLENIKHGCEFLRGARTKDGAFTSVYYRGKFANEDIRKLVSQHH